MSKPPRVIDEYVAEIEASFGGIKSNRTLGAELSNKERANERARYRETARIVATLFEQWDRAKHATIGKDVYKDVSFAPRLTVYPDGSKRFSCAMHVLHYDLGLLDADRQWRLREEKQVYEAQSLDQFKQAIAPAYELALPYTKDGFKPSMYSVRTVTLEIHFPGYCPSPIPEYVTSLRKDYSDPFMLTFDREYVEERLVAEKPWCPVPDEPRYMLLVYELQDDGRLYAILPAYRAFRPLIGLDQEKRLRDGHAIDKRSLYALAWQGITPFARELTRWHTQEMYYMS
jgi:hypothetical protein